MAVPPAAASGRPHDLLGQTDPGPALPDSDSELPHAANGEGAADARPFCLHSVQAHGSESSSGSSASHGATQAAASADEPNVSTPVPESADDLDMLPGSGVEDAGFLAACGDGSPGPFPTMQHIGDIYVRWGAATVLWARSVLHWLSICSLFAMSCAT
eukprot:s6078_g7.t1